MNEAVVHTPPRIRGIKEAITELKASDPETALTEKGLRRLIVTGKIPTVKLGRKYLINMEVLIDYLYDGTGGADLPVSNCIRVIKE